jgi:hypothetical protein
VLKKILLYSPDLVGHPRVYCRVIADALIDSPCELFIALGLTESVGLRESPDLQPLQNRTNVQLIDCRHYSRCGQTNLTAEELVEMQNQFQIDTTLFIEADKFNIEFQRIAAGEAPRLKGRNIGIFANTAEWYPGEDSFTGARKRILTRSLRTTLGNIKRAMFNRRDQPKYFYEDIIINNAILDEIIVKDERLAEWRGPPVYWMPEISRPVPTSESVADRAEYELRARELAGFLERNSDREAVLYFGDAAYYKGYDLFLQFIAENPLTCGVHPGRSYDEQQKSYFEYDVDQLRSRLLQEGRLYETNTYVHTQSLKELFFNVIRVYITFHRLALSSSTVIQAAEFGKPVLVPDRGLLAYRARRYSIGRVYQYGDLAQLRIISRQLWNDELSGFTDHVRHFWLMFSDSAIRRFFLSKLIN